MTDPVQEKSKDYTVDMLGDWLKRRSVLQTWRKTCLARARKMAGKAGLLSEAQLTELLTEPVAADFLRTAFAPEEEPLPEGDILVRDQLAAQPHYAIAAE